jgi:predicted dehydrogenase
MIRCAVLGYGYWGPNLVRNFAETKGAEVVGVSDSRPECLTDVRRRYPAVNVTCNPDELIQSPHVDAILIATPVASHFDLAMRALRAGKHVLVEKPMTMNPTEGEQLIEEAERRRLLLMVDHTFLYTAAVRKMRDLRDSGQLGSIYYYDSVRINLGLFQQDVNVIWDLAVHDLSIMDYLIMEEPCAVSATGIGHFSGRSENIAYLTLLFPSNLIAHIHVNWLAPVKIRRTLIGGSKKMIVYDDLEASEKVKVYDKGITLTDDPAEAYQLRVGYRSGDVWAPHLETREALSLEAAEFVRCIESGQPSVSDGMAGLRIVQMLDAATRSMKENGRPVPIEIDSSRKRREFSDSIRRLEGAVSDDQGGDRHGSAEHVGEHAVRLRK